MNIKIGLILAAGQGKRMELLSDIYPKCLLPLYDRPLLFHILENFEKIGIKDTYISVKYKEELIKGYYDIIKGYFKQNVEFIIQNDYTGSGEAIYLLKDKIKEPFITSLGDDCTVTKSLKNLVNAFYKKQAYALEGVVFESKSDVIKSTCCLEINEEKQILNIIEKPLEPKSNIRGCGIYVFNDNIFEYIKNTIFRGKEKIITDVISLVSKDKKAYCERINGFNVNINNCDDLLRASNMYNKYKKKLDGMRFFPQ